MNIENVLSRLDKVRSTGRDRWTCCCPAHEDKSPSMHIKLDDSGRILINCKAGCGIEDILGAAGLEWSDVMPDDDNHETKKPQKKIMYATEALQLIKRESMIIVACGIAIREQTITVDDLERAKKAMAIITKVYSEVVG